MSDQLSFQEVEESLESILNNKKLTKIDTLNGVEFVVFSFPAANEILQSRYYREKALLEAKKEGLPTIEDIDNLLSRQGFSGEEHESEIKNLKEKLKAQRKLLEMTRISGRRIPIQEVIDKYERELEELESKGEVYYYLTQEKKADEESILYLAWASTYNILGEKYWPTFQDFENETDLIFRANLVKEFSKFNRGLPVKTIRFLARHSLWRIRYVASTKTGGSLFVRDLYDLTTDQLFLLYWSNYYQSIYEMLPDDQPDSEIIEDDEALDKYMEAYMKRRESDKNEGRLKKGSLDNLTGKKRRKLSTWEGSDEVVVTPNHPQYSALHYSEERVQAPDGAEVEVVSPNSKRARNRRQRYKPNTRAGRPR